MIRVAPHAAAREYSWMMPPSRSRGWISPLHDLSRRSSGSGGRRSSARWCGVHKSGSPRRRTTGASCPPSTTPRRHARPHDPARIALTITRARDDRYKADVLSLYIGARGCVYRARGCGAARARHARLAQTLCAICLQAGLFRRVTRVLAPHRAVPPTRPGAGSPSRHATSASLACSSGCHFLIHDRDSKFSTAFDDIFRSEAVNVIHTPIRAPQANAYAERFVRTIRAECLDWLLILGRRHLEHVLRAYTAHYNRERPHRGLGLLPPEAANATSPLTSGDIKRRDQLGGLIHEYYVLQREPNRHFGTPQRLVARPHPRRPQPDHQGDRRALR
jgi:hypothetical protein